jgi:general secretion pathway protein G
MAKANTRFRTKKMSIKNGFTLMEMLVVLVIIGLIAMVAIPQVSRLMGSSKNKAAQIQMETMTSALRYYELDTGSLPTDAEGLAALWKAPAGRDGWNGPYIRQERQLRDPWGNAFVYQAPNNGQLFRLVSRGADGKDGGSGEDADIVAIP